MNHDCLPILAEAIKKVVTEQSSYINGPHVDWLDVAAQVVLQCDNRVVVLSKDVYALVAEDIEHDEEWDQRIPYALVHPQRDEHGLHRNLVIRDLNTAAIAGYKPVEPPKRAL